MPPFRLCRLSGGDYPYRFIGFAFPDRKDGQYQQHPVYLPENLLAILAFAGIATRDGKGVGENVQRVLKSYMVLFFVDFVLFFIPFKVHTIIIIS